jgi:ABC-2 type transport system permease protein
LLKGFTTILVKELKELMRDPKILVGMIVLPLIMFPILGLVMGYAVQTAQSEAQKATLLVVDNDNNGTWSNAFVKYLNSTMNAKVVTNLSPQNIVDQDLLGKYNSTMFLEIPSGFSANLTMHAAGAWNVTGMVNVYGVFNGGGGIFGGLGGTTVTAVVGGFNRAVAPDVVAVSQSSIIKGQIEQGVDASTLSGLMLSQSIALPITIMIMLTYAMQIAATSVAMERKRRHSKHCSLLLWTVLLF